MCFSAGASFAGGALISTIGVPSAFNLYGKLLTVRSLVPAVCAAPFG